MAGDALGRGERRGVRRGELLDAAVEAIRVAGPGATMEQLARAGGVTKPILYRHFRDRDGLITAIAERVGADLLSSVQAPLAPELEQPQRVLQSTLAAYVGFSEGEPPPSQFLIRTAPHRRAGGATA